MNLKKLGNNFTLLQTNGANVFFSYETPIGVQYEDKTYVCENVWSRTTGKHLNYIKSNYHAIQLPKAQFDTLLAYTQIEQGALVI